MPDYYDYVCENGHETRAYRNARKCSVCGAVLKRKPLPLTDEERWVLRQTAVILRRVGQWHNAAKLEETARQ